MKEGEALEHSWLNRSVETAQKRVEQRDYTGRKRVLDFDDVMNMQREVIYRERRRALFGEDLRDTVLDMNQRAAGDEADKHCPKGLRREEWDTHKLFAGLTRLFGSALIARHLRADELHSAKSREEIDDKLSEAVTACYNDRENVVGADTLRGFERWQVMRSIDEYWMEHLAEMDYLRDAIWQEGYAQKEPIGVYRQEGFALFSKMLGEIRREVTENLFSMQLGDSQASVELDEYSGPSLQMLSEERLVPALMGGDEDGLDDGVQFDKDADGSGSENVVVQQRERTGAQQVLATIQEGSIPSGGMATMTRAERRKAERAAKKEKR